MPTDDERRRVEMKLREYASWDGEEDCLVDCADWGERVLNLLGCGDTEGECYAALADLIEPSCDAPATHTDATATRDVSQYRRSDVDRDALLALADEMEEFGSLPVKHPGIRVLHNDDFSRELGYARRIRKALGVES